MTSPETAPLLAEAITVHHGPVPSLFLPNGSVDVILSAGSPLPAPWGAADMLIQVKKARALHVPAASADAFRIPLEIGAYRLLIGADEPIRDGIYPTSEKLRMLTESGRTGDYEFDPVACLAALAQVIPEPRTTAARRFRQTREVLEVARLGRPYTVESWSRGAGVSVRRLERMLQSTCGTRPKHFLRILRLNNALATMPLGFSLCEIADEYHFSDQSHFTRECRALTGLPPSTLRGMIRTRQIFSLHRQS